ncbi:hypothetical protein FNV43_RR22803 [Rhamnella rubrinervis]|uniref:AB hydrolase-1 domain-containing protein n=1 Tax=Rhamnella rubrinervis TaxID=2594499 RepID=A0A8K0DS68_9ROSA|nr:hypothetical protein FNV43_RR22803 [Rhamnella rubrinervis]
MVNIIAIYKPLLYGVMRLAGVRPQAVEIEPGTVMNIWVPVETRKKTKKVKKALVFLLHGFAANGILTWQFQVPAFARTYAVYVPDFIFFGSSITDKVERSVGFQSQCVAKGLMKLGVEKCTLVRFSYGGMVGFKMAELYPSLVEFLVVSSSVMALTESITQESPKMIGTFSKWSDYLLPDTVKGEMFDNRKEKEELLEALVTSDKDFIIPRNPQRVGLLWGANDKIFDKETAFNIKKQLGDRATVECIEKAGHLVQIERPSVYNRRLKKILASLLQDH